MLAAVGPHRPERAIPSNGIPPLLNSAGPGAGTNTATTVAGTCANAATTAAGAGAKTANTAAGAGAATIGTAANTAS
jgi:hypothetical protein